MRKFALILLVGLGHLYCFAQQDGKTVVLLDQKGNPLPEVIALEETGEYLGSSDDEGRLQIKPMEESALVVFRYLGYADLTKEYGRLADGTILKMTATNELLDEVIVIGRADDLSRDLPYQAQLIGAEEISLTQPQTTAEALAQHGSVFVQRSQQGGGSPVLRGFEANKVLLVVDGIRMNNAIYRSGHLQNSITVDQHILNRAEVVYGPGSLLYGSDALGGVVHFRTRNPSFYNGNLDRRIGLRYDLRYNSAYSGKSGHIDFEWSGNKVATLTSVTGSSFGNMVAGSNRPDEYPQFGKRLFYVDADTDAVLENDDPDEQIPSGYDQLDILQKVRFYISRKWELILNAQYSTGSDIPRYDQLTLREDNGDFRYSSWYYGPQTRLLTSLRLDFHGTSVLADEASLILSRQFLEEDRISRLFAEPERLHNLEDVEVLSASVDAKKILDDSGRLQLLYGIELHWNDVISEAYAEDIETGERSPGILTRYPSGGSDYDSYGAYLLARWKSKDEKTVLQAGGRYSLYNTRVSYQRNDPFTWPEYFYEGIEQDNDALTLAAGGVHRTASNWEFKLNAGTAFRAPNIDDFAKLRVKGENVTVPNPDLDPEKTFNLDGGIGKEWTRGSSSMKVESNIFYTRLDDAIVRREFTLPNGDPIYEFQGQEYNVQANVNAESGYIYGVTTGLRMELGDHWKFEATYNYTYGRSETDGEEIPLAHIPPEFGRFVLGYSENRWEVRLLSRYNGWKRVEDYAPEGSSDNIEYATEDGTYGWTTFNIYGSFRFTELVKIHVGVENIADLHYRPFSSGISAAGRNFKLGVSGRL